MIRNFRLVFFQISIVFLLSTPALGGLDIPPTSDDKPLPVYIAVGIIDIYDISDSKQSISLSLVGKFRWNDPRLAHEGPGMLKRNLGEIWIPQIIFTSLQESKSDLPRHAEIYPNGDVVYRILLRAVFSVPINLRDYPFDRQVFRFPVLADYYLDELVLLPDPEAPSYMVEKFTVSDWDVKSFGTTSGEGSLSRYKNTSRFEFYFEAVRRSEFIILTFIIPLILIVGMSWVVFWIDPKEIRSQFSVSVTTILTLIAYHISLGSRLPEIPYLTRMDFFIFGSTIIVFASLFEVLVTSHLAGTDQLKLGRRIDVTCRWLFPLAFALVTVFTFVIR